MSIAFAPPAGLGRCRVGVGLPSALAGVDGDLVLHWASRAEELGFSSLGVLDRVVYAGFDPLVTLAAAAAVTSSITLATTVLISPLRNPVLLDKQVAALDALARHRVVLGVGLGARRDDYERVGVPYAGRAATLDDQLAWLCESSQSRPTLLVGGSEPAAFSRMARFADGYVFGGGPPKVLAAAVASARRAWVAARRPGRPRIWAMAYFALGDAERGDAYLRDYYAFLGPLSARIASGNLLDGPAVRHLVAAYEHLGCDELILFPTVPDTAHLERLAEVVPRLQAGAVAAGA